MGEGGFKAHVVKTSKGDSFYRCKLGADQPYSVNSR